MGQATRASELRRLYRRWMLEPWNGDLVGGNDLLRARGDRFAGYWVSSDGLALMGQLGALGSG
jgi:hypothetical protein